MGKKFCLAFVAASLAMLAFVAAASAMTLGTTTPPTGAGAVEASCAAAPQHTVAQLASDPSTPYFVPAGGGLITQWQTNVTGATIGAPVTFAVLRPAGGGDYTVVGADSRTIPTSTGVATFTLASPIAVQAGETLGLYSASPGVMCVFAGGSTPPDDQIMPLSDPSPPPAMGQTLTPTAASPGGVTLNVAATLVTPEDAGVSTTAGPSGAAAGHQALLSSTVTNNGPGLGPISFVDQVPSGLSISSAVAGGGSCSTSGQTVTCTISGLSAGQSAPVDVVVTAGSPGSFANSVSVVLPAGTPDPNTANNTASAMLSVAPFQSATCIVPKLKGISAAFAKTLLKDLGCRVKTKRKHSRSVHKGLVIGTSPGPGTHAYRTKVTLKISK